MAGGQQVRPDESRQDTNWQHTNWAGNLTYRRTEVVRPRSVTELQEVIAGRRRVRVLGSRHSFSPVADTDGTHVVLDRLDAEPALDEERRQVTVPGGATYRSLAPWLHERGWALPNLPSLLDVTVAGAAATGTHGSGDRRQGLASAIVALDVVGADGELRRVSGDGLEAYAVALGALGVVARLTLAVEPVVEVAQRVWLDLPWAAVEEDLDAVTSAGDSVSLFTDYAGDRVSQVWVKTRGGLPRDPPPALAAARPARGPVHMLAGADPAAATDQSGRPGAWHERLPHFRAGATPSRGRELQSEYLLPRSAALTAVRELRGLADRIAPVLQVSEIRTVAADRLWLSPAFERDVVGLHFTWTDDWTGVRALLPEIETVLLPLGARPHWGKCSLAGAPHRVAWPRLVDFAALRSEVDPGGSFDNDYLARVLPG